MDWKRPDVQPDQNILIAVKLRWVGERRVDNPSPLIATSSSTLEKYGNFDRAKRNWVQETLQRHIRVKHARAYDQIQQNAFDLFWIQIEWTSETVCVTGAQTHSQTSQMLILLHKRHSSPAESCRVNWTGTSVPPERQDGLLNLKEIEDYPPV